MLEDPKLKNFVKVDYKPNTESVNAYVELTGKIPDGIEETISVSYLKKLNKGATNNGK